MSMVSLMFCYYYLWYNIANEFEPTQNSDRPDGHKLPILLVNSDGGRHAEMSLH